MGKYGDITPVEAHKLRSELSRVSVATTDTELAKGRGDRIAFRVVAHITRDIAAAEATVNVGVHLGATLFTLARLTAENPVADCSLWTVGDIITQPITAIATVGAVSVSFVEVRRVD